MLLLVMTPQLNDFEDTLGGHRFQQPRNRGVDVFAIGKNLRKRGSGEQATQRPRVADANRFIVRVKEKIEALIENLVVSSSVSQDHRLEEPRCMRQVPFRGTGI